MAKESAGGGEGRQGRRRWRIRNALGLLLRPSRIDFGGDVPSGSPLGGGALAALRMRRGALTHGILVLAMMAALLASVIIVPRGLNGPPPAVAQSVCGPATIALSPLAEGFSIRFTYDSSGNNMNPTGYRFRHALDSGAFEGEWSEVASSELDTGFIAANEWRLAIRIVNLEPLTLYKVQAQARCNDHTTSAGAATTGTVTTEKTRTYNITLTRGGTEITELQEFHTATLTFTLDSGDVFDRDVDISVLILGETHSYQSNELPAVLADEVTIASSGGSAGQSGTQTLSSAQTTLSWTITAVQDNTLHSASLTDDEYPLESAMFYVSLDGSNNGALARMSGSWDGFLRIRDSALSEIGVTTGTVLIQDSSTGTGPEIRDTLTARVTGVSDTEGAPSGGYVYEYAWLRNGAPILDADASAYVVSVDDVGGTLAARVQFRDALNNLETLTSDEEVAVPSGPVILAPNGYIWDSHPQTDNTITVDTSTMNYSYMPANPTFSYLWRYVDAAGAEVVVYEQDANEGGMNSLTPPGIGWSLVFAPGNTTPGSSSYVLAEVDNNKYLQVTVSFTDADNFLHTRWANVQTPLITESTQPPPPPPPPPSPTPTATPEPNIKATGTVLIDNTTPEPRQTLTASFNDLEDLNLNPMNEDASFANTFTATLGFVWLRAGQPIDGATEDTYVVQGEDVGLTLSARITFKDLLDNDEMLTSDPTSVVASGPVIQAPSGYFWDDDPTTANTISVDTSVMNYSYLPANPTFTYQWIYVDVEGTEERVYEDANGMQFVNPETISLGYFRVYAAGNTTPSSDEYELAMADDEKYLQVRVSFTDTNSVLQTKLANIQTPQISEFTEPPDQFGNYDARGTVTISDTTPEIRDSLTASLINVSDRNGLISATYSYQWYDGGQPIRHAEGDLAVGDTYEVEVKDIGRTLSVQVQFTDDDGFSEMLTSEPMAAAPSGPVIEVASGYFWDDSPTTDNTISVDTSVMNYSYLPANATFMYQWIYVDEDGTKEGETTGTDSTSQTYGLTSADTDKYLQVEVTFTDTNSSRVTKLANMRTPQISDAPPRPDGNYEATGKVIISNTTPEVGESVTASLSNVADRNGLTSPRYRYIWYNGGRPVLGGEGNTYRVQVEDIGLTLSVRVRFRDDMGFTEILESEDTEMVPSGPVIVPAGDYFWDNDPTTDNTISVNTSVMNYSYLPAGATFTYQWIYVDRGEEPPLVLPGEMSDTYTLTEADDMRSLQVRVTFTDTNNDSVTKLANMKTPLIRERPPLKTPRAVTATTSFVGGSVRLSWDLTSLGENPSGFKYRYKPTALLDNAPFTDSDWVTAPGGSSARSVTITDNLINSAGYTFEVASYSSQVVESEATTERATTVYRQKTRGC